MLKKTYYEQDKAREVAWRMTGRSRSPVWLYEKDGGWQVTGRGDLTLDEAVMPPLPLLSDMTHTTPRFDRGHTKRPVYRIAYVNGGFTQMHQPVPTEAVASVLRRGAAIVMAQPRGTRVYSRELVALLRPLMGVHFLAVQACGCRHTILLSNEIQKSAIADAHDTIVLHQILGAKGKLFRGVEPYGFDAGR